MSEVRLPYRDPKRPPFRRDPNFRPLCYEIPIMLRRPEWLWSEEELQGQPREEPALVLSYRESGRSHTIVWAHPKQWCQWKNVSLFGDAPPFGLDRSKVDEWSHGQFCEQLRREADRDGGRQFDWLSGSFEPVPEFSDEALKIWFFVEPLSRQSEFDFGFLPARRGLH